MFSVYKTPAKFYNMNPFVTALYTPGAVLKRALIDLKCRSIELCDLFSQIKLEPFNISTRDLQKINVRLKFLQEVLDTIFGTVTEHAQYLHVLLEQSVCKVYNDTMGQISQKRYTIEKNLFSYNNKHSKELFDSMRQYDNAKALLKSLKSFASLYSTNIEDEYLRISDERDEKMTESILNSRF